MNFLAIAVQPLVVALLLYLVFWPLRKLLKEKMRDGWLKKLLLFRISEDPGWSRRAGERSKHL